MLRRENLNATNSLLGIILLIAAVVGAAALVWVAQTGGIGRAVFVSVAVVATVAALSSLEFGLMALIFVAAVDGFLKGISPGWHTQLLKDYILAICLLRWAWLSVLGHRRESLRASAALPILVFGGWTVVQLFNVNSGNLFIGLAGLRMWTIWLPVFFLAHDAFKSRREIERMAVFLVFLMTPVALYGILQYSLGMEHLFKLGSGFRVYSQAHYAGTEGLEWRPPSTMVSPHALAGTLTMVVLMAVGLVGYFNRHRMLQAAIVVGTPIMGIGILITAVRNAAASVVIGGVALLVVIRRFDLAMLAAILGVLVVFQVDALSGGEATARVRSILDNPAYTVHRVLGPWRTASRKVMQKPLGHGIASGVGLGRTARSRGMGTGDIAPESRVTWIENEYGRALLETGIPGFIFFVWMLYAVIRSLFKAHRVAVVDRDKWLLAGMLAACTSMLARLLVGSALYGPGGPIFWLYAAMAARIPEIEQLEIMRRQFTSRETRVTRLGTAELPWKRAQGDDG